MIGALITFLAGGLARYFTSMAVAIGLQKALHVALAATWFAFVGSFTLAANLCVGAGGVCSSAVAGFSGLSTWLKFGFSLVPYEIVGMIGCLLALHATGYCFLVMMKVINHMSLGNGTGLRKI